MYILLHFSNLKFILKLILQLQLTTDKITRDFILISTAVDDDPQIDREVEGTENSASQSTTIY